MVDLVVVDERLTEKPALRVARTSLGHGRYRLKVTAGVAAMGPSESAVDTRPVTGATITLGGRTATTDAHGVAIVSVRGTRARRAAVSAGTTLKAGSVLLK